MRSIDLQITKGKIESIGISFNETGLPDLTATVALFTADDKKISTFNIATYSWNTNRFDIPLSMVRNITDISLQVEEIVMNHCKAALGRLEAPKAEPSHGSDLRKAEPAAEAEVTSVETPLGEKIDAGTEEEDDRSIGEQTMSDKI